MAVSVGTPATGKRRVTIGASVLIATAAVVGIVVVSQMFAFNYPRRMDMTSGGVNSLSPATERLLEGLDKDVRITSLYFEADLEDKDQPRYRQAAQNLIDLYAGTNRTKIRADWVNPLKDQEKFQNVVDRLREIPKFQSELTAYSERVDKFQNELSGKIRAAIQSELGMISGATTSSIDGSAKASPLSQVEVTLRQLDSEFQNRSEKIDGLVALATPEYGAAVNELKALYASVGDLFKRLGQFGRDVIAQNGSSLPPEQVEYLQGASGRLLSVVGDIEGETTKLNELEPLSIDKVLDQMLPNSNAILVDTDDDALIVDFSSMWPPVDQGGGARAPFERRAFKGEEKLTSAILRVTHKEQTAVVFVRYGGGPLFAGGFMPGQPPAPYTTMKEQLEDANFVVKEWDLKTQETPPAIDPVPTRTIFIVMRPESEQNPFQQQQAQPFSDVHREKILKLLGDSGRAIFVAGWAPMFGSFPAAYEYGDYLKDKWGIEVIHDALLMQMVNIAPGQYGATRDAMMMSDLEFGDSVIFSGARSRAVVLPLTAPLELTDPAPEGVDRQVLITVPARDGLWGVKSIDKYREQLQSQEYITKEPEDLEGPFTLAVAAEKGDAKIAVISSREFASDGIAFARRLEMTPSGIRIVASNPGNISLLVNTLHWLNDNTEFMNIGQPIDSAVLEVPNEATVKTVQAITIGVWPALALVFGGITWWIRRR